MKNNVHWVKTHCARMDHGGCALLVGAKDNRIVEVKADPEGYLNKGYICTKGLASPERLSHPARLRHPLQRRGKRGAGKWDRITWPQALMIINQNLRRIKKDSGARAVAFCQGMPKGLEHFVLIRLANIFGSPNVVAVQDVCHAPREISGFHTCGFYPVADYHHLSRLVVLWGSNITSTNEEGQICRPLLNQIKKGTDLMVVDPRKTDLAAKARIWLQLKPGTDIALALAFLNVVIQEKLYDAFFVENWTHGFNDLVNHVKAYTPEKISDVTWVPADLIRQGARIYAQTHPAVIGWGNAIEHSPSTFDTARALVCLMAICGNLDVPGGNIQANEPNILGLGKFVRADLLPDKKTEMIHAHHHAIRGLMTVPPSLLKKAIIEKKPYAVKAAYVQCANPLIGYADSRQTHEAFSKLDFLAVSDIFMTPTASLADLVLPAATHFEFNDIGHYGLGHGYILARPKVVDPPRACWPDLKILNELGRALTGDDYWFKDYEDLLEAVLKPSGLSYDQFVQQGYLKGSDRFKKYLNKGFRTPTGKVELSLSRAEKLNVSSLPQLHQLPRQDPNYPLVLTCAKNRHYLHSSYRWVDALRKRSPEPVTHVHPKTAKQYGIREGDEIIIETPHGKITQIVRFSEKIHPQVVYTAYGWWFPEQKIAAQYEWQKSNYNMLTSTQKLGREFGTPRLKGIGCRIRRK
jgi:anaerobic selenocysteine-containing dehydrogenase